MKHVGIAAVTAEGAALCYRTICSEASRRLGAHLHPEITMHTHSFSEIVTAQRAEDWGKVADLLLASLQKLKKAGADFAIIPANSVHFTFDAVKKSSPLPLLSIVETAADVAKKRGYGHVLTLGVGITMARGLFTEALQARGIRSTVPDADEQERMNAIIYDQIVPTGSADASSVAFLRGVVAKYKDEGCNAVLLGCTELPLVLTKETSPLPTVDTTVELALAAVDRALA